MGALNWSVDLSRRRLNAEGFESYSGASVPLFKKIDSLYFFTQWDHYALG
jgi:hypothetical protein